jgi:minor extracellular serine protease Vpr
VNLSLRSLAVGVILGGVACGQSPAQTSTQEKVPKIVPSAELTADVEALATPYFGAGTAPSMRNSNKAEMTTVVVELSGDSVAVFQANAPGNQLSQDVVESVSNELKIAQRPVVAQIESSGGNVMATYQHAMNGIKVRIPASRVGSLTLLPGVKSVRHVGVYKLNDDLSLPYIGAPAAWNGPPGFHGEGINVADIDTGIDYTHADFGGPGTVAAYQAALATDTAPPPASLFGLTAPKVKGGIDLVGDHYGSANPDGSTDFTPAPDGNPLDCNSHGSHTAGTIAGFGVTTAGATYTGPYDNTTFTTNTTWNVGPCVAPKANIYAVRVFGCAGSTNVVTDAIEWVMDSSSTGGHPGVKIQVINMSLGSDYGNAESSDALVSTNASNAGIIVAAASGNASNIPWITSSPAAGDKVLTVAAIDSHLGTPGVVLTLNTGKTVTVQVSNGAPVPSGSAPLTVVPSVPAEGAGVNGIPLGCRDSDYANVAGKVVVTARGICARIYRAQAAFHFGAVGVILENNASGPGIFEGPIQSCIPGATPDNASGRPCGVGETPVLVTIPMYGLNGPPNTADAAAILAATSETPGTALTIPNATANQIASFSSAGPRIGYSADGVSSPAGHLKPNITGPGVSINSAGMGTGTGGLIDSGTSMATPHVAGVAALAIQAHPAWTTDQVRLAIANTASPTRVTNWAPRTSGGGLVQPFGATSTQVVVHGDTGDEGDLSLGTLDIVNDFSETHTLSVQNISTHPVSFSVASTPYAAGIGRAHTVTLSTSSLTVAAGRTGRINVTIAIPAATAGTSAGLREVGGFVTLTPTGNTNGGAVVNVPYYAVVHGRSDVSAAIIQPFGPSRPTSSAIIANDSATVTGSYDFYTWGGTGTRALGAHGIRGFGVKSAPAGANSSIAGDKILTFAFNTFKPNSTLDNAAISYQVNLWVTSDPATQAPDFGVFTEDFGLLSGTGAFNGQIATATIDIAAGALTVRFLATAPFDSTTALLPTLASDVGLTAGGATRFTYNVDTFFFADDAAAGADPIVDDSPFASFNAFSPALTASVTANTAIAVSTQASVGLTINQAEFALTPAMGIMIVSRENANGRAGDDDAKGGQALFFKVKQK